ncbi:Coadhesin,Hemicentin-1,Mucin-like protein [Mytilus edulis]|uniref:Coadhesin,Hemicentin-1,Mucin-like protein n=1 Tax=Mytilus edulis TaxID=6550 RepID=A0A8S3PWV6_MYTED|nr:Coadhesin,Hemicentin-1,Mucin-like protein [Mytilus edulis]
MCTTSCGNGYQQRRRRCNSPIPSAGGSDCNGTNVQRQGCNVVGCPVDGNWSGWSSWNICSARCNGGVQDRTRICNTPQPSNGGLYCNGINADSRPCNNVNCEVHGQWGHWQGSESCNTTCGNGIINRSRNCDSPSPMFGGSDCIGPDFIFKFAIKAYAQKQPTPLRITRNQPTKRIWTQRSNGTQSGVYDNIEIGVHTNTGSHTNTQMNCNNEELYENLKL